MVEHAWVRIAELREDAAWEEWELAHPRVARLRRTLRLARIRALNQWIDFRKSPRGQHLELRFREHAAVMRQGALRAYLGVTRTCGCRPSRARAAQLTTRQLIDELNMRGIEHDDCVERRDLLDALCGEASGVLLEEEAEGRDQPGSSSVDKMV